MTPAPLHIAGERLMLDPAGLLAWPARQTLVVGDLHLEKGSAFARAGRFLPPYDTRETLARLQGALRRWRPQRLIALGDSFHDAGGAGRMAAEDAALLHRLLAGIEMLWVLGNHDPVPPAGLPGQAVEEHREGRLTFRHEARRGPLAPAEISGHFHPKATMPTRCGGVTRPCFVADAWRVVLPAFGAYAGGLDAGDPAIAGLFPRGARLFLLGRDRLYSMPAGPARPRPAAIAMATDTGAG
ncbi:ligase-associated DNA damage response endonuclease PdeM [Roseicella frigidaeris]|uniref:Ligase-associated DNA damage response endonuclease PdeM n=1 Tax=Roseicella frigidaeris TaxID=2230885 RepID=A0A327M299_9PROT|nr:ligase-associated DNA damage response endonuclease PdeM [Roseicella frigidaeris]RAI57030.1 ligase-associated DNA damage response endonuclease PdeM [Roseicella frigidaeris]